MDIYGFIAFIAALLIGVLAQQLAKWALNKNAEVECSAAITGKDIAREMLESSNVTDVGIVSGEEGADCYDPETRVISLSPENYSGTSVTAVAVACHEAGHAIQHAKQFAPIRLRGRIVKTTMVASYAWCYLFLIGFVFEIVGLIWAAIVLYVAIFVFHVINLPVEIDASKRACAYLKGKALPASEYTGAKRVLQACASTYVAAALASLVMLLRMFGASKK